MVSGPVRDMYTGRVIKHHFRDYIVFWTEELKGGKRWLHAATKGYGKVKCFSESKLKG